MRLNEKSAQRRRYCALAVVKAEPKIFAPPRDPLPGGAGRTKFNQLEMVTTFTYKPILVRMRCTQFRVIVATDPQTNKHTTHKHTNTQTNPQTGPITIHCAAASYSAHCNELVLVKLVSLGSSFQILTTRLQKKIFSDIRRIRS